MRLPYYLCLEHIQQQPACNLLYVKQQEGCYIILVYKISLIIESLFLYYAAFLKERNAIAKNLVVIILVFLCVHTIINLL